MAIYHLILDNRLPGLNEYTKSCRGNKYGGNNLKKETENEILWQIKTQLCGVKITKKVNMVYTWIEPNKKRDKDNIAFAKKFIQDALVKSGVLKNDGWGEIEGFSDFFVFDKDVKHGKVKVDIAEVG